MKKKKKKMEENFNFRIRVEKPVAFNEDLWHDKK